MHKTQDKKRRRLGDRKDGRLIRTGDPMMRVATFIMPSRTGAQNFFQDGFSTEEIDAYIQKKRQEGYPDLGILHIIIAAYVRTVSQNPGVNRFIGGLNLYARNDIQVIMAVKNAEAELQKIHDKKVKDVEALLAAKSKEIMTV